jgi:hypothetical protein
MTRLRSLNERVEGRCGLARRCWWKAGAASPEGAGVEWWWRGERTREKGIENVKRAQPPLFNHLNCEQSDDQRGVHVTPYVRLRLGLNGWFGSLSSRLPNKTKTKEVDVNSMMMY